MRSVMIELGIYLRVMNSMNDNGQSCGEDREGGEENDWIVFYLKSDRD